MISSEGLSALRLLGIKSELDLRTQTEAGSRKYSVIGKEVTYYFRTLSGSKDFTSSECSSTLKNVFKVLADENQEMAVRYGIRQAPTLVVDTEDQPAHIVGVGPIRKYIQDQTVGNRQ